MATIKDWFEFHHEIVIFSGDSDTEGRCETRTFRVEYAYAVPTDNVYGEGGHPGLAGGFDYVEVSGLADLSTEDAYDVTREAERLAERAIEALRGD